MLNITLVKFPGSLLKYLSSVEGSRMKRSGYDHGDIRTDKRQKVEMLQCWAEREGRKKLLSQPASCAANLAVALAAALPGGLEGGGGWEAPLQSQNIFNVR